jgi:regulator of sigma E protease
MPILIFIVILGGLILIHEFGHFIVAKRSGIRVDEFGIGFPPRLFRLFKKGETEYTVNVIPFGGFVKIFGENPTDEARAEGPDKKRSFVHKSKMTQMAVIAAGIVFNILTGWILLSLIFAVGFPASVDLYPERTLENVGVTVTGVLERSPAAKAGFKDGDVLTFIALRGEETRAPITSVTGVQEFIGMHNYPLSIEILRDTVVKTIEVIPEEGIVEGKHAIGISMDEIGFLRFPAHEAVWQGALMTYEYIGQIAVGLGTLVHQAIIGRADFSQVSGPVGIVGIVDDVAALGPLYILRFAAIISINLGILNLLPFPALDGGRLFFLLIEAIRRKPLPPRFVIMSNTVGFVLLIILMVAVTWKDIVAL